VDVDVCVCGWICGVACPSIHRSNPTHPLTQHNQTGPRRPRPPGLGLLPRTPCGGAVFVGAQGDAEIGGLGGRAGKPCLFFICGIVYLCVYRWMNGGGDNGGGDNSKDAFYIYTLPLSLTRTHTQTNKHHHTLSSSP
jgi:hypothetical protein